MKPRTRPSSVLEVGAARVPLEREVDQPVEELAIRDPRRLEELGVDARRREARDRIELVDDDFSVGPDEEIDARHPLALRRDERVDREAPDPLEGVVRDASRDDQPAPGHPCDDSAASHGGSGAAGDTEATSGSSGIYPGANGARIEDIVVCTEDGAERLNNGPRDLVIVEA